MKEAVKSSTGFKAIITRQRKGLIHEMEMEIKSLTGDLV